MIHHAPPRLTPQQALHCRQCRVVDTSARLGLYFTPQDREWARQFARRIGCPSPRAYGAIPRRDGRVRVPLAGVMTC